MTKQEPNLDFRALHHQKRALVIPNPWDTGTARILASMGFKALATTSAGMAFSLGVHEGATKREAVFEHCRTIVNATPLPVSADLENGFGDSPERVGKCIEEAQKTGLSGASIEDFTGNQASPIYDFNLAVERISAAVEKKNTFSHDFILTARCENFLWGKSDLDDTIKRLQAFEAAGADVLYAPGLTSLSMIKTVCDSVSLPVNVVMGMPGVTFTVSELEAAGVKRISLGSALARAAFGTFVNAALEIKQQESFTFSEQAIGFGELSSYFEN